MRKPYGITQEQFDSMTDEQLRLLREARKQDAVRRESNPIDKLMRRNRSCGRAICPPTNDCMICK